VFRKNCENFSYEYFGVGMGLMAQQARGDKFLLFRQAVLCLFIFGEVSCWSFPEKWEKKRTGGLK